MMKKRLLALIFILFLGIGVGVFSEALMATNDAELKQPEFTDTVTMPENDNTVNEATVSATETLNVVEEIIDTEADVAETESAATLATVVETEPKTTAVQEPAPVSEPEPEPVVQVAATPVYVEPANNIKITGKTLEIVNVDDTAVDAGDHVNRYGKKFLYGHNSEEVFGGLKNVSVGAEFSVTLDGVTTDYRVEKIVIFEKNMDTGRLELDGTNEYDGKDYMNSLAVARFQGTRYSLSIMTCYGTPYPGRDASHRLVIFANAV